MIMFDIEREKLGEEIDRWKEFLYTYASYKP
jgi:hypothetical protein